MDVLSEVLRVVRLSGVVHFRADFSRPWAIITSPPEMLTTRLIPGAESVTPFHVVTVGGCRVTCGKIGPIDLAVGDVIVIPRGDQHVLMSDAGVVPVPIKDIYRKPSTENVAVVRHGGGGDPASFICGFLHADQRFAPLLESLPQLLIIRARGADVALETFSGSARNEMTVAEGSEAAWWISTVRYFSGEASRSGPGNQAVLARLSELLEVMRWQLRSLDKEHTGWLAGLNDPQVGRVLALLHAEPAHAWTVEELADRAGISRAVLAKRFTELVGDSPIQYLAGWRMHLARQLLRESTLSMAEIAERVGYESEAAFNRAFRRSAGSPPATWRREDASLDASIPR